MQSLLADHNLRRAIVDGVLRRRDVVFPIAYGEGLAEASDPDLLEWAALRAMVVVTHDASTMPAFAYVRLADGRPFAGMIVVPDRLGNAKAIDEICFLLDCTTEGDWPGQIYRLPLRP